jgi:hypothetical protein
MNIYIDPGYVPRIKSDSISNNQKFSRYKKSQALSLNLHMEREYFTASKIPLTRTLGSQKD